MKTRAATKRTTLALLLMGAAATGCGKHEPRYGNKTYGQVGKSIDATVDSDAPATGGFDDALPPDVSSPVTPEEPAPRPTATPEGLPPVEDDADDLDPTVAPETVILKSSFRAIFDLDSARGLRDGDGVRTLGAALRNKVQESLTTTAQDGMIVSQTFGDGESKSTGLQAVTSSAGDANRTKGRPSTSGVYTLDRIVSPACPNVLLCVGRVRFVPVEGESRTLCFYDPETGSKVPFPYSVLPNYKARDFTPHLRRYGPYNVVVHIGADIDCDAPPAVPLMTESVFVDVSAPEASAVPFYLHLQDPIPAQHAVSLVMTRAADDMVAPYLDETALLNFKNSYVMNEDQGEIVKIVVTSRQSIALGRFATLLFNLDGVLADLHFELCKNLLDVGSVDHCEGAP